MDRTWIKAAGFVVLGAVSACDDEAVNPRPPDKLPESVAVPAAQVEVGTANGTIRKTADVESFAIAKFPITVRQYRECQQAGACSRPSRSMGACASDARNVHGRTYRDEPGDYDELPVTCTDSSQAAAFCHWVGGRLPSIEEWLYAARGASVQRHAWGAAAASCDQHPAAVGRLGIEPCCPKGAESCDLQSLFGVGRHPNGKSPLGIEDVLLTEAELVAHDENAAMPACRSSKAGCAVESRGDGAIEAVVPVREAKQIGSGTPVWSFRCVWER